MKQKTVYFVIAASVMAALYFAQPVIEKHKCETYAAATGFSTVYEGGCYVKTAGGLVGLDEFLFWKSRAEAREALR